jgi:hypothetical protein
MSQAGCPSLSTLILLSRVPVKARLRGNCSSVMENDENWFATRYLAGCGKTPLLGGAALPALR